MIQAKFGLNWPSGFRGEDFFKKFTDGRITKNRNFFKWPKLLYFKPECAQI
jgi:hypothetical protein